jgi:collagen type VII alpha
MKLVFTAVAILIIAVMVGCGDNDRWTNPKTVPVVTTAAVTDITQTTAQCGGNITSDGGAAVTARGVCWSTNPTPTTADNISTDGSGTGSFTSSVSGLTAGTDY